MVGVAHAAAECDDLVSSAHQPRHKVRTDMAGGTDDDNSSHVLDLSSMGRLNLEGF
jgi:hypothetical protein